MTVTLVEAIRKNWVIGPWYDPATADRTSAGFMAVKGGWQIINIDEAAEKEYTLHARTLKELLRLIGDFEAATEWRHALGKKQHGTEQV